MHYHIPPGTMFFRSTVYATAGSFAGVTYAYPGTVPGAIGDLLARDKRRAGKKPTAGLVER